MQSAALKLVRINVRVQFVDRISASTLTHKRKGKDIPYDPDVDHHSYCLPGMVRATSEACVVDVQ